LHILNKFQKKSVRIAFFAINAIIITWFAVVIQALYVNVLEGQINAVPRSWVVSAYILITLLSLIVLYHFLLWKPVKRILDSRFSWILIFTVVLIARLAWLYLYWDVDLESDFALYMLLAQSIAQNSQIPVDYQWYVSFAPYVLGYATFLAALATLFGNSLAVVQAANCVLSAIVAVLLFLIGKKLAGRTATGVMAAVLWIIMPTLASMTSLPQTELLFIVFLLSAVYAFLVYSSHSPISFRIPVLILALVAIVLMNEIRPLGILVIAALIGFLFSITRLSNQSARKKLLIAGSFLALVFLSGALLNEAKERFLGIQIARNAYGFGLYLGLNEQSTGTWSLEDAAWLGEAQGQGLSAQAFHASMLERSRDRFNSLITQNRFLPLLRSKILFFWSNPNGFLDWISELMPANYYKRRILETLFDVSNYLYFAGLFFGLTECLISFLRKDYHYQARVFFIKLILVLYFLTMAIFDNNARYVVPTLPLLFLLAASGIQHITDLYKKPLPGRSVIAQPTYR